MQSGCSACYNETMLSLQFYFWYLRIKGKKPKNMGGFTRILHSGEPDDWMHEIPTVIVKPLPADLEKIADVRALMWFDL